VAPGELRPGSSSQPLTAFRHARAFLQRTPPAVPNEGARNVPRPGLPLGVVASQSPPSANDCVLWPTTSAGSREGYVSRWNIGRGHGAALGYIGFTWVQATTPAPGSTAATPAELQDTTSIDDLVSAVTRAFEGQQQSVFLAGLRRGQCDVERPQRAL
jgi:hypothetical protein